MRDERVERLKTIQLRMQHRQAVAKNYRESDVVHGYYYEPTHHSPYTAASAEVQTLLLIGGLVMASAIFVYFGNVQVS
jgi:hypothetical protein